jgi:hypothetical protein
LALERFRGSVHTSGWGRGAFWNRLDADETVIVFRTLLSGATRVERAAVDRVEFERIRLLPFRWETNVRLRTTSGQRVPIRFVPFRPNRLRRSLETLGWPVADVETVTYRVALARALGIDPDHPHP